jgi:F5/8 type C domain-containing protein
VNEATRASFTVQNTGGQAVSVNYFLAGARTPTNDNVDFPTSPPVTLQPSEQYTYQASRSFATSGTYAVWPAYFNGTDWIELAAHTSFTVQPGSVSSCQPLPVAAVTAIGDDGNVPANTLDGNFGTRWSNLGIGSWITYDLGAVQTVDAANIAWYQGDTRVNNFVVSVSTDGTTFTQVHAGQSSGLGTGFELTSLPNPVSARYLRITVNGNTTNNWGSITEARVCGTGSAPPPPAVDAFGIKMIYPTKAGGEQWAMNMASANADPRFNPQATITKNADGSWKIQDTSTRMLVFTSTGYDQTRIASYDPDVLQQQGYMQATNDWRNIEMTGYVRVNAASVNDSWTWYARGGRHNDVAPCEGTSYKGDLFFDGGARVAKESWHVSYDFSTTAPGRANRNQWIGFKMALYNVLEAGKLVPHVELYVNKNLDKTTWTKVYDFKDDGTWAGDMLHCGGSNALMPITWGGPIATFRWDNASDTDFKWLSVREIQVP